MGLAMDMVGFSRTAGGGGVDTAFTASVVAPGDTFTVRNFNPQSFAFMVNLLLQYVTAGAQVRVRSPLLHDNVQGLRFRPGETPIRFSFPKEQGQILRPQDTLIVEQMSNLASEVNTGCLTHFYQDLPGANARLHMWGDVAGLIKNLKPVLVAAPENAAAGSWQDTVITTSEDLLKANTDYAVLGYMVDRAEAAIAIKGPDTSNLRVGGPGDVRTVEVARYFVDMSQMHMLPMIPVINSANKGATFVSVLSQTTGNTPNVQLMLAELSQNIN